MKRLKDIIYPFLKNNFSIFSILIILIYSTKKILFQPGYLLYGEFFGSVDYFHYFKDFLKAWSNDSSLGHSNIGFPSTYGVNPVFFIGAPGLLLLWLFSMSLLQFIFGSFTTKVFLFIVITAPFISMYLFVKYWWLEKNSRNKFLIDGICLVSGLIYVTSGQLVDRISAGHVGYVVGYGLLTLQLLLIFKATEATDSRKRKIFILLSALTTVNLLIYMPHILTFLIFIYLYYLVFLLTKANFKKVLWFFPVISLSSVIAVLLVIHAWLPALFYSEYYPFIKDLTYSFQSVYYSSQRANIKDILTLVSGFERNIYSLEKLITLYQLRFLFPIASLIGLIIYKDKRKSLFAFFLLVTGLLLSLGIKSPLGLEKIFEYSYKNLWLFKLFRDISKFPMIYAFAVSITAPLILIILHKINKQIFFLLLISFIWLILYLNPLFISGNFGKAIIPFKPPVKYSQLKKFIKNLKGDFRVAIYPNSTYIGNYDWYRQIDTTNGSPYYNVLTSFIPLDKSVSISNRTLRDYGSRYLDFLESNLNTSWAIDRLGQANIRYLIIDYSLPKGKSLYQQLKNNPRLEEVPGIDGFSIFKIRNYSNQYLVKNKAAYYYGDMNGLRYLPANLVLIDLGNNSIDLINNNLSNMVLLYKTTTKDLFLTSLKNYRFSFLPEAQNNIDQFLVSADNIRTLSVEGINTYNPESIFTGKINDTIKKPLNLKPGNYRGYLSLLTGDGSVINSVSVKIGKKNIIKKDFQQKDKTFVWLDLGKVNITSINDFLVIKNLEDKYLIIDSLLLVPEEDYQKKWLEFQNMIKSKKIITFSDENINSKLETLPKSIYILSNNYSPYWDICQTETFIVNFYGVGADCQDKINPLPKFKPTKLYQTSIMISFLFYLIFFGYLVKLMVIKTKK